MNALLRAIEANDAEGAAQLLDATPSLLDGAIEGELLPEQLGAGRSGNPPLHAAAFFGSLDVIDLLLQRGADTALRNAENRTALHVALEHNFEAVQHLEARGIPRDVIAATCRHDHGRLRALLEADASLANDRSTGLSVIGWGTYYGARESCEILFAYGARGDDFELNCAAGVANTEIAELLLDHGADVNQTGDGDGATALHVAVAHPYSRDARQFVDMLLRRGVEPSIRTTVNRLTAAELAEKKLAEQTEAGIAPGDPQWKNFAGVLEALRGHGS